MKDLLELNKKLLIKGFIGISGILTGIFLIYLYFFYSEVSTKWILIILSLTLIVLPSFVVGSWVSDWFRKRKFLNRIQSKKPYSQLKEIGFIKKLIVSNKNGLKDYVIFAEINDLNIVFDVSMNSPKVAEFKILGISRIRAAEIIQKGKELESQNIDFGFYGFTKTINTKKEPMNSIYELEKTLTEFTHIVKKIKFEPAIMTDWEFV